MELMDALVDASRVAHYHPLRPEVPLEVLSLDLVTHSHTPHQVRAALENLATLAIAVPKDAFHRAMTALSPWRDSYLYAKGLSRDAFPLIAIEATSTDSLTAAEAFFSAASMAGGARLGLFLRVQLTDDGDEEDDFDTLARVAEMLRGLRNEHSRFELKIIEIAFDTERMRDRELEMASRVLSHALQDDGATAVPAFKISVRIAATRNAGRISLAVWRRFFQTLCRVGVDRDSKTSSPGNELAVSFGERADPRVVVAFWSALAFGSGYSRLTHRSSDDLAQSIQAKYMALALLSSVSQVTHLDWQNSHFQASTVDAMMEVRDARSRDALSAALWSSEWSYRSTGDEIDLSTVNQAIVRQFGWVLFDSGDTEWIDVFLPGFGQCSVKRDKWYELTGGSHQPSVSWSFRDSKVSRFESALQLSELTTHVQAARFFRLIGESLRFIELRPWGYLCSLELLLAIFESCPLLRELTIHQMNLAPVSIDVDSARLVATNIIKLKLLFASEESPVTGAFTEAFFETVIPIVGKKMEYLELRKESGIIPFACAFHAITQSCVSLFHLKLEHLDIETLDPLIEAYRHGTSRISSLYLLKSPVTSDSLVRFAEFLADRTSAGSFKLGVLHVTHFGADNMGDAIQLQGLDAASIKAMLVMLETNHTLTELYLGVTDMGVGRIVPDPLRPFKRRFDVYDEQEIPVASEKYPVESTVALVDALQRKRLPFDQETIRIVTAFAAQRIRRSVRYDVAN